MLMPTFSRMGIAIKPQMIRQIQNNRGQVIEVFESKADKVFPVEPVARLVDMMQDTVKYGTGTQAKLDDRPVAGKTGTADAAKDIWFVGYTPDMCTAIWGGNDENLPIPGQHVTGGDVMAKIWKDYAKQYYLVHPTPPGSFVAPTKNAPENNDQKPAEPIIKDGQVAVYPPVLPMASPVVPEGSANKSESVPVAVPVGSGVVELRKQAAVEDKNRASEIERNSESIYAPAPQPASAPSASPNIKEFKEPTKETREPRESNVGGNPYSYSTSNGSSNASSGSGQSSAASSNLFIQAAAPAARMPTPLYSSTPAVAPRTNNHQTQSVPVAPAPIMMNMNGCRSRAR